MENYNENNQNQTQSNPSGMDARITGIIAYITWIGFLIAYLTGDKENAKFHLNQALVYNLFVLLSWVPIIGWLWAIFMSVCFVIGIINAATLNYKELPLIGKIHLLD